jgi:osmotically-inducible protein OsmY
MDALAGNPHVHVDEIAVQALGDYVIVRGTVAGEVERAEVVRTARHVSGVRVVEDRLHVRPFDVGQHREDADTEAAVMAALIADSDVPSTTIDVKAHGDQVTLSGRVDDWPQRDHAERIALGVGGVKHVDNKLGVFWNVSADDVAGRVHAAIAGADRIDVEVRENDVTLTGTVGSEEDRAAALAAAADTPGVEAVRDQLTVRSPA